MKKFLLLLVLLMILLVGCGGGKVTDECIKRAKKSKNPTLRKRATFAANARKWKHEEGGIIKAQ